MVEFQAFPKIARLFRPVVVTEKIDGTNAQLLIVQGQPNYESQMTNPPVAAVGDCVIYAGQRTKFCTPEKDNFGFARWVQDNADQLVGLGPGLHFGEWWGAGIQRRYGLAEKRFSLFNVGRWHDAHGTNEPTSEKSQAAPLCCYVVPILASMTILDTAEIEMILAALRIGGSKAAPGFMQPEGVVAFHTASGTLFKATLDGDSAKERA